MWEARCVSMWWGSKWEPGEGLLQEDREKAREKGQVGGSLDNPQENELSVKTQPARLSPLKDMGTW